MTSVFFDTNVWLPAGLGAGFHRRLIEGAELAGTVFVSEALRNEVTEKLALKFRVPWEVIEHAHALMEKIGRMVTAEVVPHPASPDPDDAILLAQAVAVRCEYFVTNDRALLEMGTLGELAIVTPRRLAELLEMS